MENSKYYLLKTPSGISPKVYSENAKERIDAELWREVEDAYAQRLSVLTRFLIFDSNEMKYIEDEHPDLVGEFKLLFPCTDMDKPTILKLYRDHLDNQDQIKRDRCTWKWEEVVTIEE